MIISILNEKGGVGKTTLATNLAYAIKNHGTDTVLLIDSDPQGSARDWHQNGNGDILDVIGLDRLTLDKDIQKFKKCFDFIFIDGAPQLTELAIKAIICSDVILIPVQPSPYDVWASKSIVDLIKQRQKITNGKPKAAFIVSRQIVGTKIGNEVREILKDYELPVFRYGTFQRIIYAKTAAIGETVYCKTDEAKDSHAKGDIQLILHELWEFIQDVDTED
jgi:chromosome partitioning protein